MNKDQGLGVVILLASVIGILVYGGLLFFAGGLIAFWVLKITAFIAVAGVLAILAWIGYTLATTPPPQPIEELEKELQMSTGQAESSTTNVQSQQSNTSTPTQATSPQLDAPSQPAEDVSAKEDSKKAEKGKSKKKSDQQ